MPSSQTVLLDDFCGDGKVVLYGHRTAGKIASHYVESSNRCGETDPANKRRRCIRDCPATSLGQNPYNSTLAIPLDRGPTLLDQKVYLCWQTAGLSPFRESARSWVGSPTRNYYAGMGAMLFPTLVNGIAEQGLWCRGCHATYTTDAHIHRFSHSQNDHPECLDRLRSSYRAWSKAEILLHARDCPSATKVIQQGIKNSRGLRQMPRRRSSGALR